MEHANGEKADASATDEVRAVTDAAAAAATGATACLRNRDAGCPHGARYSCSVAWRYKSTRCSMDSSCEKRPFA